MCSSRRQNCYAASPRLSLGVRCEAEMRKRSVSLAILAVILAWLALAGFVNAAGGAMGSPVIPGAYGVTAAIAAIGLWRARSWGFAAYLAWVVVVLITAFVMENGLFKIPTVQFAAFMVVVILLLTGGGVIAWRGLRACIEQTD